MKLQTRKSLKQERERETRVKKMKAKQRTHGVFINLVPVEIEFIKVDRKCIQFKRKNKSLGQLRKSEHKFSTCDV